MNRKALMRLAIEAVGAVGSAAFGPGASIFASTVKEMLSRHLSDKEAERTTFCMVAAAKKIKANLDAGKRLRDDGFFDKPKRGRSQSEQIAENVLMKAQREPEDKKQHYLANLLANLSFDWGVRPGIYGRVDPWTANSMIATAESLTYRQLCLLRMIDLAQPIGNTPAPHPLPDGIYLKSRKSVGQHMFPILYEVWDLLNRNLVRTGGQVFFGIHDVDFGKLQLSLPYEKTLVFLLGLDDIPDAEIENWRQLIFAPDSPVSGVPDGGYVIIANSLKIDS